MGLAHEESKNETDTVVLSDRVSNNSQKDASSGHEKHEESENKEVTTNDKIMYPTGIRLVLLAGASIMGVFLISLDQVRGITNDTAYATLY